MSDFLELAERCEKAEGRPRNSSRNVEFAKLDCEIWLALNPFGDGRKFRKFIRFRKPGLTEYGAWTARTDRGDVSVFASPAFTASLDAAMTLVPEDCKWSYDSHYGIARVDSYFMSGQGPDSIEYEAEAATPALALTAACLRARAANPNQEPGNVG